MIIDFHVHVFPPAACAGREEYCRRDGHFQALFASGKAKMVTADQLVQAMDVAAIDQAVVLNFGWTEHEMCVATNDYILEAADRFGGRLIPYCVVQPAAGELARREIERCAALGARGIGELMPDPQGFDLGDRATMQVVAETAEALHLPVLTHASEPVGHSYPGKGTVTPTVLMRFIESFPDLTIVLAHLGGGLPFYALMQEVREALRNVYFDTAAQPFLYQASVYEHLVGLVGAEKVLFGSDYPLIGFQRYVKQILALNLPDRDKQLILAGNALRLLQGV